MSVGNDMPALFGGALVVVAALIVWIARLSPDARAWRTICDKRAIAPHLYISDAGSTTLITVCQDAISTVVLWDD